VSHQVSSKGFRVGKSYIWNDTRVTSENSGKILNKHSVDISGLENSINQILRRDNLWLVKLTGRSDPSSKNLNLKILYYPVLKPTRRNTSIPTYLTIKPLVNLSYSYDNQFKKLTSNYWTVKDTEFADRFIKIKKKVNFNKWFTKNIFKGSQGKLNLKAVIKHVTLNNLRSNLKISKKMRALAVKQHNRRRMAFARRSRSLVTRKFRSYDRILKYRLARDVEKRTGLTTNVKLYNIFRYIEKKNPSFSQENHQNHLWHKYHFNKWKIPSYFDVVNSLLLLCYIPGLEHFVARTIQYALLKMHKKRIRPKPFFYFIDSVLKNLPQMKLYFESVRVIITGKLRGGTSRTKSFSTGFGAIPNQSLNKDVRHEYGDIRSKYGSFGLKIFTLRKSQIW